MAEEHAVSSRAERLLVHRIDWSMEDGIAIAPFTTPSGTTGKLKVYLNGQGDETYDIDLEDATGATETVARGISGALNAKAIAEEWLYEEDEEIEQQSAQVF